MTQTARRRHVLGPGLYASIGQKIFQRFEQERTKSSAIRIGALEEMTFKDRNEKILREILGVGNGMAAPADEGEDRPPISLAKLGPVLCAPSLRQPLNRAGKNHAPARRVKPIRAALPIGDRFGVHSRPVS